MLGTISGIAIGAVGGTCWAILGSTLNKTNPEMKQVDNTKVDHDWKKFFKSTLVGAILGGYAGSQGMPIGFETFEILAAESTVFLTATAVANKVIGIGYNALGWLRKKTGW